MGTIIEEHRPLSRERAQEVLANGSDGWGMSDKPHYTDLLTDAERVAVVNYWLHHAPGGWSPNDTIRECAR